ncbi:MAG: transposase [Pseudonocardiaceae bacterium]
MLANILRTDLPAHRPLPTDSELAQAIAVLAHTRQDAVWDRTRTHTKPRSQPREYYPGIIAAFADKRHGLLRPDARAVLAAAPTPRAAAKLTKTQPRGLPRRAGRQRGIDTEPDRLQAILRADYPRQLPLAEDAFGRHAPAPLHQLGAACASADELATAVIEHFDTHPDTPIITSQPGLGAVTSTRTLTEIGDDRSRFSDARALKAYAGSAPVTRASGKSLAVIHRRVKNQRLATTGSATSGPSSR